MRVRSQPVGSRFRERAPTSPATAAITAAVLATVAMSAGAQRHFDELEKRAFPAVHDSTRALAVGDVDGDGDLDMVVGNDGPDRLYLNDGTGTFTDASSARLPADSDLTTSVVVGDIDGDGDIDVACGNKGFNRYRGQQNRLYLNDGAGALTDATAARMPGDGDVTRSVAFGDIDGDGDLDLVLGNDYLQQNRLYLNDGTGRFTDDTAGRMPARGDSTLFVAVGDLDGDGDLDLVIGNGYGEQNRLYLNDGTGTFTDATTARMPTHSHQTSSVSVGDVDGDGDPDLVLGNFLQNRLYLNDGTATFTDATAARMPVDMGASSSAVGDIDGDGDLDLVFGVVGLQNRLYLNDGTGTFTVANAARMPIEGNASRSVAAGDVDGDGDLDLVFGNRSQQNRLYINLLRQLNVPFVPVVGKPYTVEAYARYGPPSLADFALPFVSTASASLPLPPLGTLRIDPTLMVALPWFVIPQPAGIGAVSVTIPNLPAFVGITLYSQALLLPYPIPGTLSNGTADLILR